MTRLKAYTKSQLKLASREAIGDAMSQLPLNTVSPSWLGQGDRYAKADIKSELKNDHSSGALDSSALARRLAASIPSHVVDGWSLFGRAIHCLIRGDTRNSVHLGYYSELRAALAVLASEGIGIFDKQHYVIDSNGVAQRIQTDASTFCEVGTHSMLWPVYNWWSQQSASGTLAASIIQPGGSAIIDWFTSANWQNLYLIPNIQSWLTDWALDLKRMNRDFGARNAASYGPSAIHNWQTTPGSEAVNSVVSLWEAFEPWGNSRFNDVDGVLLKSVLMRIFQGQTNRRRGSRPWYKEFTQFVNGFLHSQTDPYIIAPGLAYWQGFLCSPPNGTASIPFEIASEQSGSDAPSFPIEMLSRAALLLRIATGSCGLHLADIGANWESLKFWLDNQGTRRGFWKPGDYPDDPIDLWTNIDEAIQTIRELLQTDSGSMNSPFGDDATSTVSSLTRLEECERIGFWGLGV